MRSLLLASTLIVLTAASAPSILDRFLGKAALLAEVSEAANSAGEGAAESLASSRQVEIRAEGDGHFYVDAEINFRPVRLMVDTGATVVALRQSDAAAAGIRVHVSDFSYPVSTANGTTKAAEAVIDNMIVADIEVEGVRALILPDDQLAVSLLGGTFLTRLARFEIQNGTLIFEN